MKVVRGLKHDYLAMILDFTIKRKLRLNMVEYTRQMIKDIPYDLGGKSINCPWTENLFKVDKISKVIDEKKIPHFRDERNVSLQAWET